MALQDQARAFTGQMTAFYDGKRIPIDDASSIAARCAATCSSAGPRLINARFAVTQGPFDLARRSTRIRSQQDGYARRLRGAAGATHGVQAAED
jgi:hypothetical protein